MSLRGSLRCLHRASIRSFYTPLAGVVADFSHGSLGTQTISSHCLLQNLSEVEACSSDQHNAPASPHVSLPVSPAFDVEHLEWKVCRSQPSRCRHQFPSNRTFTSATPQSSVDSSSTIGSPPPDESSTAGEMVTELSSSDSAESDSEAVAPKRTAADGTAPRFYKRASAAPAVEGGGWVVKLDHRILKTPAKKPLKVPTEALALAIAAEWEWQEGRHLRPFTMPMMKLAATAIDQISNDRERVIGGLLKYFHTDSVCLRAPPSLLADKQSEMWDPLLHWVEGEIGARPITSSELLAPDQPQATVDAMERVLRATDDWQLASIDSLAGTARSLVIGLAVARQRLGISEAMEAIRLEEDFQVEEWGFVEGGHDVDIADLRVRIAAPSVFLRMLELK